ncbi:MAG TPA: hypothetical protein VNA20_12220 [Frankiaceae bacterium]|nr:hypothetical protein [Frankiaceae bacterium]
MAITVNVEQVTSVRIGDEWTAVLPGSFVIDSLAWTQGGGEVGNREMGFQAALAGGGGMVAAPLSALTGVRYATDE